MKPVTPMPAFCVSARKRLFLFVSVLALTGVVLFSGQRRPAATTRPAQPPRQTTARKPQPPKEAETPSVTLPPIPLVVTQPENIAWGPFGPNAAPQNVILLGDPGKPELYVIRTRFPKGKITLPHVHPEDRTVVVLEGTYYYGLGEVFDETRLIAFPPGTFLTEPAGQPHFSWSKDGEVIIQTTAVGPTGTRVLPDPRQ